jgi:hypothetical protein
MAQPYNKFNGGIGAIVASDSVRFDTDAFIIGLSNTLPTAGQAGQTYSAANITEIATGNGYTRGTNIAVTTGSNTNTGGVYTWVGTAALLTASGGTIGPFQYAILYDNTSATKPLLGWWATASAITMADTDTFQISWASNQILSFS